MSSGMVTEQQPAPGPSNPPPSGQGRSPVAARMDARAALKAQLEKGEDAANDSASPKPGEGSASSAAVTPSAAADEAPGKLEATKAEKVDPETEKRLAKVQDAEKRSREKLAAEKQQLDATKAEIEKARAELEKARAEVAEFAKLKERAKLDPASALKALGVDDLEYAAKQAYALSKAKADDPNNREAAARAMREREQAEELKALRDEVKQLRDGWQTEKQQATIQQRANAYMEGLVKQAGAAEDAPLLRVAMGKAPDATRQKLARIAIELAQEIDDEPDHADVIARYEKTRRAELEEFGVDINSILSPSQANQTKKNEQAAEKKNAAPTLSNDLTTPRVARTRETEREKRANVLAELEKLSG